ncbi:DNA polymerase IV [Weissella diestrammenae]|uniref:DNA polymerase IV n=1 Tax=Weissella diestrammenae TaxID=1162633 RepID=A0A7G9T4Y9_9LACO|nr:DNA polymerase IV [Weissella diestrammenae]MCM0582886.1 DNA polymerase IV [Weissella diestrammenae]QNN75164.1 DNA polymerase IV [Weissella diestrammenae]
MADLLKISLQLNTNRQIIHVDMDAFYAQIEMRDHPDYEGQAIILASDPRRNGGRGVVATANYQARELGVHSAMSAAEALKLAPNARFIRPNFEIYRAVSKQVHAIFHRYTDMVEPIAFDEAYLDVTHSKLFFPSSIALAHHLQQSIYNELHLTCSVGISFNKFLAKLGSEHNKPAGLTMILPDDIRQFLDPLPVKDIRGIGAKTAPKMYELGIQTGYDLFQMDQSALMDHFGKMGYEFYRRIRGVDDSEVAWQRERKSIGNERTYAPFLNSEESVFDRLQELSSMLVHSLEKQQMHGKTIVLKVRDESFTTETRRETLPEFIQNDATTYFELAESLWEALGGYEQPIRLLGLTMTSLAPMTFDNLTLDLYGTD